MRDGGGGDGGVVGLVDGYVLGVVVGADLAVGGGLGGGLVCGLGFHFAIGVLGLVSAPVGLGCHGLYISCPGPGMSGGWVRRHIELGEWERFRFCTLSFGYNYHLLPSRPENVWAAQVVNTSLQLARAVSCSLAGDSRRLRFSKY